MCVFPRNAIPANRIAPSVAIAQDSNPTHVGPCAVNRKSVPYDSFPPPPAGNLRMYCMADEITANLMPAGAAVRMAHTEKFVILKCYFIRLSGWLTKRIGNRAGSLTIIGPLPDDIGPCEHRGAECRGRPGCFAGACGPRPGRSESKLRHLPQMGWGF